MSVILWVLYFMFCSCAFAQHTYVEKTTKYGRIRGMSVPYRTEYDPGSNMRLQAYVGVPYATPPVGSLRWTRTQEPQVWQDVYNATRFSPCCPQNLANLRNNFSPTYNNSDEDCLYLNIYVPLDTRNTSRQYAVMFYIHGGSYRYGMGEEHDSRILAQSQNVVVVTINYRLGVLGFLSTDDEHAEGNFGLLDMIQALKFVQENIAEFRGDPARVMVFGNSAGGGAVGLLVFSPLAKDLFSSAAPQSGTALSPWAVYRPPNESRPKAVALAQKVSCPTDSTQSMLECLRNKPADLLVHTSVSGNGFNAAWAPRVDGHVIPDTPESLVERGQFNQVNLLTGTVSDEVSDEYTTVPDIETGWSSAERESRMYSWSRRFAERADIVNNAILHQYDHPGNNYSIHRDLYIEMRSDDGYVAKHNAHVHGHSKHVTNTWLYSFEYRSEVIPTPAWMGVPHFEEQYFIFGAPFWRNEPCPWGCNNEVWFDSRNWTSDDESMSRRIMAAMANFAKTGNPNPMGDVTAEWRPFNSSLEHYMVMNYDWQASQYYKYQRCNFWNQHVTYLVNTTAVCQTETPPTTTPSTSVAPPGVMCCNWLLISIMLCFLRGPVTNY